ncbi:MAG: hypothetical protein ABI114_02850 [Rhodanobacter sp.]
MSLLTLHHSAVAPEVAEVAVAVVEELGITAKGAAATDWQREQMIDEELAQSFPASDPPSWVQGTSPEPS